MEQQQIQGYPALQKQETYQSLMTSRNSITHQSSRTGIQSLPTSPNQSIYQRQPQVPPLNLQTNKINKPKLHQTTNTSPVSQIENKNEKKINLLNKSPSYPSSFHQKTIQTPTTSPTQTPLSHQRIQQTESIPIIFQNSKSIGDTKTPKNTLLDSKILTSEGGSPRKYKSFHQLKIGNPAYMTEGQKKQHIKEIFEQLGDINDTNKIHQFLKVIDNAKDRSSFIDLILKRKKEISEGQNLIKLKQCAPLINRFIKKIGRKLNHKFQSPGLMSKSQAQNFNQSQQTSDKEEYDQKITYHAGTIQAFFSGMMDKQERPSRKSVQQTLQELKQDQLQRQIQQQKLDNQAENIAENTNEDMDGDGSDDSQKQWGQKEKSQYQSQDNPTSRQKSKRIKSGKNLFYDKNKISDSKKVKNLNYNKISEISDKLIEIGRRNFKESITTLLDEYQLKTLSHRFNSSNIQSKYDKKLDQTEKKKLLLELNSFYLKSKQNEKTEKKKAGLKYDPTIYKSVEGDIKKFYNQKFLNPSSNFFVSEKTLDSRDTKIIEKGVQDSVIFQKEREEFLGPQKLIESEDQNEGQAYSRCFREDNNLGFRIAKTQHQFEERQLKFQGDVEEINNDLLEKNDSFASYTEIRLDQLYRNTKHVRQQLDIVDRAWFKQHNGLLGRHGGSQDSSRKSKQYNKQIKRIESEIMKGQKQEHFQIKKFILINRNIMDIIHSKITPSRKII